MTGTEQIVVGDRVKVISMSDLTAEAMFLVGLRGFVVALPEPGVAHVDVGQAGTYRVPIKALRRDIAPDPHSRVTTAQMRDDVLRDMAAEVRAVNEANGWFDSERSVIEGSWLLASEAFEAGDAYRKFGTEADVRECRPDPTAQRTITINGRYEFEDLSLPPIHTHTADCKPVGYGSELADVLIRLLDQADRDGVDLVPEFDRKLAYNRTRGYRHGGRKL